MRLGFDDILNLAVLEPSGHFRFGQIVTASTPAAHIGLWEFDEV
jgi:hypothetical protein